MERCAAIGPCLGIELKELREALLSDGCGGWACDAAKHCMAKGVCVS